MWVERLIEGDRNARIKLDKAPWTPPSSASGAAKHGLAVDRAADRRRLGHLLQRRADLRPSSSSSDGRRRGLFLRRSVDLHHLRAGRLGARAGLHLHVPVAALPGRDVRRGQRSSSPTALGAASRAASTRRATSWEGRGDCIDCNGSAWRSARWASTSATASSWSASAARCASTPATRHGEGRPAARPDHLRHRAQPGGRAPRGGSRNAHAGAAAHHRSTALILLVAIIMLLDPAATRSSFGSTCCTTATRCSSSCPTAASATAIRSRSSTRSARPARIRLGRGRPGRRRDAASVGAESENGEPTLTVEPDSVAAFRVFVHRPVGLGCGDAGLRLRAVEVSGETARDTSVFGDREA